MGKRSTGRKRGIQRGVGKHKIKIKPLEGEKSEAVFGLHKSVYASLGEKCFEILYQGSVFFQLIPFRRNAAGEYVPLNWKQKIGHYAVLSLGFVILLQKTLGTLELLLFEELKIETFMCLSLFLIYMVATMIGLGVWARPEETMDLLNSWPRILSCIQEIREEPALGPFDDISTTLKVITVLLVTQGIAFAAALMTIIMSNLPICLFPMAESLGLIPDGIMPRFGWQLLFFPLEYLTDLPPVLIAPYSGSILLILVGVLKLYLQELR